MKTGSNQEIVEREVKPWGDGSFVVNDSRSNQEIVERMMRSWIAAAVMIKAGSNQEIVERRGGGWCG
jgi:uncharacterized protein YfiM (DUF2279 family)